MCNIGTNNKAKILGATIISIEKLGDRKVQYYSKSIDQVP